MKWNILYHPDKGFVFYAWDNKSKQWVYESLYETTYIKEGSLKLLAPRVRDFHYIGQYEDCGSPAEAAM